MPLVRHSSNVDAAESRTVSRSQRSIRVGTAFGIPLSIHTTFLLLPAWAAWLAREEGVPSVLFAVALVYLIMAAQFSSWLDPLIMIVAAPLGLIGVAFTLWLTGTSLNAPRAMSRNRCGVIH